VPGTEQHAGGTSTEIAVAPFGQELIIGHADQYPFPVLWLSVTTVAGQRDSGGTASNRRRTMETLRLQIAHTFGKIQNEHYFSRKYV